MGAVIIEHVSVADLPETWRNKLPAPRAEHVTVRIEEERASQATGTQTDSAVELLFGMWRDRKDMTDVDRHMRELRAPRYNPDGSRNQS